MLTSDVPGSEEQNKAKRQPRTNLLLGAFDGGVGAPDHFQLRGTFRGPPAPAIQL